MKHIITLAFAISLLVPTIAAVQSPYWTPLYPQPHKQRSYQQQCQYNPSDPYGTKPYTRSFGLTPQQKYDLHRQDQADERNMLLQCYQYNKGCALRLRGR